MVEPSGDGETDIRRGLVGGDDDTGHAVRIDDAVRVAECVDRMYMCED